MFRITELMSAVSSFFLVIGMLTPGISYAQIGALGRGTSWPRITDVVVRGNASVEGNQYVYSYVVFNPIKNQFPINRIEIDLRSNPIEHPLSRQDLTSRHSSDDHDRVLMSAPKVSVQRIESPAKWTVGYPGLWWINPASDMPLIQPGTHLGGFVIVSSAPATIRQFAVDAFNYNFVAEPEDFDFRGTREELTVAVDKGIQFLGSTIAPAAPPHPFTTETWVARIMSDVGEARKLGWITTDRQLGKIKRIVRGLGSHDPKNLENSLAELSAYLLEEKQAGRLSNEADALLRINADFLRKQSRSLQ